MRINPATGNLECTQSQEYLSELAHFGTITVDSFFAVGKIKRRPPLAISLDSIQKLMVYPQMEKDNAISGDYTALFSFDGQGNVDSVWLNIKPYKNFEWTIKRTLKEYLKIQPSKRNSNKKPTIYRLSFHFRIKD